MDKSLTLVWWLIQFNAIAWLLMVGVFLRPDSPFKQIAFYLAGLFVAAALEWVFYYKIYKPSRSVEAGNESARG